MTANEWIAAFATGFGAETPTQETQDVLLELAGVAAHSSERVAAPIACYLVGLRAAAGMTPERALELAHRVAGKE